MHKSQGFGVARARAPNLEYFKLLAAAEAPARKCAEATTCSTGIDLDLGAASRADGERRPLVARAVKQFDPAAPRGVVPRSLQVARRSTACPTPPGGRKARRAGGADRSRARALWPRRSRPSFRAAPGGDVDVTATALNRSPAPCTLRSHASRRRRRDARGAASRSLPAPSARWPPKRDGQARAARAAAQPRRPTGWRAAGARRQRRRGRRAHRPAGEPAGADGRVQVLASPGPRASRCARRSSTTGPIRWRASATARFEVAPAAVRPTGGAAVPGRARRARVAVHAHRRRAERRAGALRREAPAGWTRRARRRRRSRSPARGARRAVAFRCSRPPAARRRRRRGRLRASPRSAGGARL